MGMDAKTAILEQKTALGIEFGSTRIKAVLIGADNAPIASGDHEWENRYDNGVCQRKIRHHPDPRRSHRLQCHDARLYGI